MKESEILEKFGKILIEKVRDYTIYQMIELLDGKAKAPALQALYKNLSSVENEKECLKKIMTVVVDNSISNFLWMLEQHADFFDLTSNADLSDKRISIYDISDGLCGDYWNFIDEYSKYKRGTD